MISSIILGCCAIASANPRLGGPDSGNIYIASEHLEITLTGSEAVVKGTFVFRSAGGRKELQNATGLFFSLPIWFPEETLSNDCVSRFWSVYEKDAYNPLASRDNKTFEQVIGLRIIIGEQPVKLDGFAALTTKIWKMSYNNRWGSFQSVREPGYCCLVFPVSHARAFAEHDLPVTITYREPLLQTKEGGVFFYTPFFDNLPKSISTADTNRYAISFVAHPACSVVGVAGQRRFTVAGGQSVIIAPRHFERIRVTVAGLTKPQGGASERQPIRSDSVRESAAAAFRRSP